MLKFILCGQEARPVVFQPVSTGCSTLLYQSHFSHSQNLLQEWVSKLSNLIVLSDTILSITFLTLSQNLLQEQVRKLSNIIVTVTFLTPKESLTGI